MKLVGKRRKGIAETRPARLRLRIGTRLLACIAGEKPVQLDWLHAGIEDLFAEPLTLVADAITRV
jgi:hypothetical protein